MQNFHHHYEEPTEDCSGLMEVKGPSEQFWLPAWDYMQDRFGQKDCGSGSHATCEEKISTKLWVL